MAVGGPGRRAGPSIAVAVVALAVLLATPTALPSLARLAPAVRPEPGGAARLGPAVAAAPNPYRSDMTATLALGQPQLNSSSSGYASSSLRYPGGITFDAAGDLWVADTENNRVLEYAPPFATGMNASLALGQGTLSGDRSNTTQSGFFAPEAVAFDAAGDLWVADTGNDRVLEFVPPFHTGMDASLVLGQSSYTTRAPGTTAVNLSGPSGLAFDSDGDLFVADTDNNRVLEFVPPFQSGMAASVVLGQTLFTTSEKNLTQTNLSHPVGLLADDAAGLLWVADEENGRVVGFSPPFSDGMPASALLGEPNFTNDSEPVPFGLFSPTGVSLDPRGNLWVTDNGPTNRVSEYPPALIAKGIPSVEEGQEGFNGTVAQSGPSRFDHAFDAAFDASDDLWVSDRSNNRILEFTPLRSPVIFTETGLANGTPWTVTFDNATEVSTSNVLTFEAINGSYTFAVPSVSGYLESPGSGSLREAGVGQAVPIAFTGTIGGLPPTTFWELIVGLLILLVIVVGAGVLLARRRGPPRPPAAPTTPATPAPPAGSGLPAGASPPPGSTPPP